MTRLSLLIGYGGAPIPLLSEVLQEESREHCFEYAIIPEPSAPKRIDLLRESDAIFVYCSKLPHEVEDAIVSSRARIVVAGSESCAHLSRVEAGIAPKAATFYKLGGKENFRQLVHLLLRELGYEVEVSEPKEVPWHGIWHPDLGTFMTLREYLHAYHFRDRDLVGLLFYRSNWLYGNVDHVTSLVKALEERGLGVVPVFTYSFGDQSVGASSAEDSIREFFFDGGRSVIQALINLTSFFLLDHGPYSGDIEERFGEARGVELLRALDVPIIQAVRSFSKSLEEWREDPGGLDYLSQVYQVIMPEVDGLIEPIFLTGSRITQEGVKRYEVLKEHADYIARRIERWIRLRKKPPSERKIAIILINPPCKGLEANIAVGFGLDVPESVVRLLHRLKDQGYDVGDELPKDGKDLIRIIMERKAVSEFRWTSVEEIVRKGGAIGFVDLNTYMKWFEELPPDVRRKVIDDWGHPEDVLSGKASLAGMVYDGRFVIPGIKFGNVLIAPQPKCGCAGASCDGQVCKILHDPTVTPPHQWLAAYRWITRVFGADVLIHFGTHGYLEFRPGKGVGLSPSCWPEISIDDVPHLYVYIVSNPMEGVVAKRRSYATIVDHIYPPMARADVLEDLEALLAEYSKAKQFGDETRAEAAFEEILKEAREHNIPLREGSSDEVVEWIHRYLTAARSTQVEMGLHVFGHPVSDPSRLAEYVATIMSYDTHAFPSIRRCLAEYLGLDYDEMRKNPLIVNSLGLTNAETMNKLHRIACNVIRDLLKRCAVPTGEREILLLLKERIKQELGDVGGRIDPKSGKRVVEAFEKALEIASRIRSCKREYEGLLAGLNGLFVEPGPSGSITRGRIDVLPTGRNFFAVNPMGIPTRSAWKVGVETAERLLSHYLEKNGRYPESIGHWLWSLDGYKTDGEQLAQILYLFGTRPVWGSDGSVKGVEVIPLEELGRPRIDNVVRVSGILRDTLPNYFHLIDEAVSKVVALDEPPELNYVRKHYLEFLEELGKMKGGRREEEARCRVWSSPPGTYGTGINYALEASAWRSEEDLAKTWVHWGCYMYTKGSFGSPSPEGLMLNLKTVELVTRNHISDEHDLLNCCCYYSYQGGMYTTVKALTGRAPEVVVVDTRDLGSVEVRELKDEVERVVRAKLLNPRWVDEMKKHGYRGANEFSRKILHLYGWSATTRMVENWVFEEIARRYVLNEEMREWFKENNVWAAEEIARRLIEAAERGLWKPSEEVLEELREAYAEIEGVLEEDLLGESPVQGGVIRVYTSEEVENWRKKLVDVSEVWREFVRKVGKDGSN